MKQVKRFLEGEEIPEDAKYLYSSAELDKSNSRKERWVEDGPFGLWNTHHERTITPKRVVHYYEVYTQ